MKLVHMYMHNNNDTCIFKISLISPVIRCFFTAQPDMLVFIQIYFLILIVTFTSNTFPTKTGSFYFNSSTLGKLRMNMNYSIYFFSNKMTNVTF